MKITIVIGAFFPVPPVMGGAIEKVWFALGQEFARRGHTVVQISRAFPRFPRTEIIGGVRHRRVRGFDTPASLLWLKVLDLLYSIRAFFVLPRADILVTNTFWFPMLLRSGKRGRLYVHVARFPKGQMRMYKHAARLQTPSHAVARAVAAEVPALESKTVVIPNPTPQRSAAPPISKRDKILLFVGRVHPEKGVHLLIEAFANSARERSPEWLLRIVGPTETKYGGGGDEYLRTLKRAAARTGSRIEMRGAIFDASALDREFWSARAFAYPSLAERGESFGLAPLEAMAHGCAAIVSDLECFHDFIVDAETGFFFDHRGENPAATLAQKMSILLDDERLLARVAEAGYRKSLEYSVARVADRYLEDFGAVTRSSKR
jgi:glycosyltransferase involved in cell wall biosynthesis